MDYRTLKKLDASQYRQLRLKALQTNPEAFGSDYQKEENYPIEKFEARIESDANKFVIGAFQGKKLVCVASFVRELDVKVRHKGMLSGMYCDENYQGKHVARRVVQMLLNKVETLQGLEFINLLVWSDNKRAIRFYESFGFKKYGTEPKALYDGVRYYDEDLMQLTIKNPSIE